MNEFEECLKRRGLVRIAHSPDVIARELTSAAEDLADAVVLLERGRWKRMTITAYYAMFHAARALVFAAGYAEKSHFCLAVAFRELWGSSEQGRDLAAGLERARVLRENAEYLSDYDEEGARAALTVARRFVEFAQSEIRRDG